jgi:hypothetical protein
MGQSTWTGTVGLAVFCAAFFGPPVLAVIVGGSGQRALNRIVGRIAFTIAGLILNTLAAGSTGLMMIATVLSVSMGGGPHLSDLGAVMEFVVGASLLSAVCGLAGVPRVRVILVVSSVWVMLWTGIGIL